MTAPDRSAMMQKRPSAAALVLSLLLLSSCVLSRYPLAENDQQVVFREELLGTWQDSEGSNRYLVQKSEGSSYRILDIHDALFDSTGEESSGKDTSEYTGQLVQVQETLFLDLVELKPRDPEDSTASLAGHFIVALSMRSKNKVELAVVDKGKLEALIEAKKISVQHVIEEDNLVLQEPPARLQQFLVQLLHHHPDVWERNTLQRK